MKKILYNKTIFTIPLFKKLSFFFLLLSFFNTTSLLAQDCSNISFSENNSQLVIDGLIAPIVIVDVYDPDWNPIFSCGVTDCGPQVLVPNLSNGEHHIIIKLFTASWSKICEQTTDFTITGVSNGNQADLSVSNFQNVPNSLKIGEVETFNFDLNNFGNGEANGAYQVEVYLSANQDLNLNQYTPGTPFVKVGEVNTGDTPIGTIPDVVGAINVPNGTALGPYYLVLIADGTEVIAESNESNNVLVSDQIVTLSEGGSTGGGNTVQCGEITINYGNGSIEMVGNTGNNYFFKIHDLNAGWAEVFSCAYQCGSSQAATGLANGDYLVRAYNSSWGQICEQEINLTEGGGLGGGCGSFEDKFTYQASSMRTTASFTEDATGYQGLFKTSDSEFIQVAYGFDGEKLNTNFLAINEPNGTFTYTGKDYYYSYTRQDKVVILNKKNLSGGIIWSKNYTLNNSDLTASPTTIQFKEMDNSLMLVVRYGLARVFSWRQVIINTDLNGNENWQQQVPLVTYSGFLEIHGAAKNGGYYLSRTQEGTNYVEVFKLNDNGQEQWAKAFPNIVQLDDVFFVGEPPDGNAAYYYYSRQYEVPVSLIKINSNSGNTLWDKNLQTLFSPNKDIRVAFKRGAVLTSDGGLVASYYYNLSGPGDGAEYGKVDDNGNFLWRQEIEDPRDRPYTPALGTNDGGVIFWDAQINVMLGVAKVKADGTFDPTCSGNTGGSGETIQCGEITINYEGATIEMQGQSGNNYFFKIYDLTDNWNEVFSCAYNCGSSQTATINRNGTYLIRVYNDGWQQICEQEIRLDDAGQRSSNNSVRTFSVFPNPAQEEISIDLNEYAGENAALFISNMYGQVIQQKRIENIPFEAIKLPLANFVNGFYFVNIKMSNRQMRSEKFLVKRMY